MSQMVGVMYLGRMMEMSKSEELFEHPLHPYTQALFAAALPDHPDVERKDVMLHNDVASPTDIPSGLPAAYAVSGRKAGLRTSRAGMEKDRPRTLDRLPPLLIESLSFNSLPARNASDDPRVVARRLP